MRLALLSLALLSFEAGAATKYISPTGSALWADCTTRNTPCALSTAQTSAAAGDVIVMLAGTYGGLNTSTNGTVGSYIVWRSETPRDAVLDGLASGQADKTLVIDNNYHRFEGVRINVQTGPGAANTYGVYASGTAWQFVDGEITYTGDEATTGTGSIIYCAQLRSTGTFTGNYVHHCTYGVNWFSSSAGFPGLMSGNIFEDFTVGDYEDSDCFAVSGAGSYDWTGLLLERNACSGWRDDGADFSSQDNVTLQDNLFHSPARDGNDNNSSCIKVGFEGSNGNRVRRNYCYDLHSEDQDNYGLILTGASDARVESNIIDGAFEGATIAERNSAGGDNNALWNNVIRATRDDGVQVGTGAAGTILGNNVISGATRDVNVLTGITATGYTNRRVNNTSNGDGTYNHTGDTTGDPLFIGGADPTTAEGFRPGYGSQLVGAGTPVGVKYDFSGCRFNVPPTIGAHEVPGQSVFKPFR